MFRKLPPEFNAAWYVATYPDAALSGLSPSEHYLRFGRLMGRRPAPPPKTPKATTASAATDKAVGATVGTQGLSHNAIPSARPNPIISRPADFDAGAVVPSIAPPKDGAVTGGIPALEVPAIGPFASADERDQILRPLIAFARMTAQDLPSARGDPQGQLHCASSKFRAGETRLENAWFASDSRIRLRIAGGVDPASRSQGWSLRLWQFDTDAEGGLSLAGSGIQFPALGPIFHEVELNHPLMPLLMELSNGEGMTCGLALLPFPSLLPGGKHAAELIAQQSEANPMDAFWSLSDRLVREFIGQEGWGDRSISAVSLLSEGIGPSETAWPAEVRNWMARLFGFVAQSTTAMQREGAPSGLELRLPQDCLPTITALVSRQLALDGAARLSGPLLVAEFPGFRPRWSVMRPAGPDSDGSFPVLESAAASSNDATVSGTVPVHLAIALRSADLPIAALPDSERASSEGEETTALAPTTIVLDASDCNHAERLLNLIKAIGEWDIELVVRLPEASDHLREVVGQVWGSENWRAVSVNADLRDLASSARHERLLTVSDRITSIDPSTLAALFSILDVDESVASASCVLLAELIVRKKTVIQPATGGLFPAGLSFASAPQLAFSEPDVRQALPDTTYPVAANTLLLTVWRRDALAGLPRPSGPVPSTAEDIRLGLDLLQAGYRNICTSRVSAHLTGSYARRDAIDPVGSTYVNSSRWEHVLGRVTLLRELF